MNYSSLAGYAAAAGCTEDRDIAQLVEAETRSTGVIADMRADVSARLRGTQGLDIVAFGSLARREWTSGSDFDYLVVVHGLPSAMVLRDALKAAEGVRQSLELRPPGPSGMFGVIASASELAARIGLETDTNQTLTRRLLMVEESVSLFNPVKHDGFLMSMLDRYLVEYADTDKMGVPRFLVNDIVRHWRTVAVDYQAKNWARVTDEGWGLRLLKLKISRKLSYVGSIAPLLTMGVVSQELTTSAVFEGFDVPPLVRIARLYPHLDEHGRASLQDALAIAGRFNRLLDTPEFREESGRVLPGKEAELPGFQEALGDAETLQEKLIDIFIRESSPFSDVSKEYLLF